jgi:hypothetical protein
MSKQSAVIDKSLVHELCKHPHINERKRLWRELHLKYQLVVPQILIQEVVVNAIAPGKKPLDEVQRLIEQVAQHHTCWLDDIHEIVFRELVRRASPITLPPLAEPLAPKIFKLRFNDDALKRWVEERKQDARSTHEQWKAEQQRLSAVAKKTELTSESEMFDVVRSTFLGALLDEVRRKEMLEHILGVTFRFRHPDEENSIDRAFAEFTPQTFTNHYMTSAFLLTRLAYVLAPVFTLPGPSPHLATTHPRHPTINAKIWLAGRPSTFGVSSEYDLVNTLIHGHTATPNDQIKSNDLEAGEPKTGQNQITATPHPTRVTGQAK